MSTSAASCGGSPCFRQDSRSKRRRTSAPRTRDVVGLVNSMGRLVEASLVVFEVKRRRSPLSVARNGSRVRGRDAQRVGTRRGCAPTRRVLLSTLRLESLFTTRPITSAPCAPLIGTSTTFRAAMAYAFAHEATRVGAVDRPTSRHVLLFAAVEPRVLALVAGRYRADRPRVGRGAARHRLRFGRRRATQETSRWPTGWPNRSRTVSISRGARPFAPGSSPAMPAHLIDIDPRAADGLLADATELLQAHRQIRHPQLHSQSTGDRLANRRPPACRGDGCGPRRAT